MGALDYELGDRKYIQGYVDRRDIADDVRAIPGLEVSTDEDLASFDENMKGPPL